MPGRTRAVGSAPVAASSTAPLVVKDHPALLGRSIAFNADGEFDPVRHPNVANCLEAFTQGGSTCVVVEGTAGGTLQDRIAEAQAFRKPLSEGQALQLFLPVALGLRAMHSAHRVHGRPHTGNCIFVTPDLLKLSMDSKVDPETAPASPRKVTEKTDLWFLGSILYEICTLSPLLCGVEPPPWPSTYSPDLHDLCDSLLHPDPTARPTLAEVFGSKFVQEMCRRLRIDTPVEGRRTSHSPRKGPTPALRPRSGAQQPPEPAVPTAFPAAPPPPTAPPHSSDAEPAASPTAMPVVNSAKWMADKLRELSSIEQELHRGRNASPSREDRREELLRRRTSGVAGGWGEEAEDRRRVRFQDGCTAVVAPRGEAVAMHRPGGTSPPGMSPVGSPVSPAAPEEPMRAQQRGKGMKPGSLLGGVARLRAAPASTTSSSSSSISRPMQVAGHSPCQPRSSGADVSKQLTTPPPGAAVLRKKKPKKTSKGMEGMGAQAARDGARGRTGGEAVRGPAPHRVKRRGKKLSARLTASLPLRTPALEDAQKPQKKKKRRKRKKAGSGFKTKGKATHHL